MMTLESTVAMTLNIIAITFILSGVEFWSLSSKKSFKKIWSFENLRSELESGLPLPRNLIHILFADSSFQFLALLQIAAAFLLLFQPHLIFVILLLLLHLLICIRFRGTFNGGSDMMKFVILSGALLLVVSDDDKIQRLGLYYICIHMILSYFKAGWAKLMIRDWRSGVALPAFLSRSLFLESKRLSGFLLERPMVSKILSWSVILFELGIIVILFQPLLVPFYFAIAMAFHFCTYLFFGLNRFFWIWLCGWPALFYLKIF